MLFTETEVRGAFSIGLEKREDDRGFFARSWCRREFEAHGLDPALVQCNVSYNKRRGTLRGMHYQDPRPEPKLVRCTRGSIHDVVLDLRSGSSSFLKHAALTLSSDNHMALFIPAGCAHGFLTLEDDTEVFYQMGEYFEPGGAQGVRYDDPAFGIRWPGEALVISDRDRSYPDFRP